MLLCPVLWAQGSKTDYQRWESYDERTAGRVFRQNVHPRWFGKSNDKFWYRVQTGRNTHEFVIVDAKQKRRQLAFDHQALARALTKQTNEEVHSDQIDLRSLTLNDQAGVCRFLFAKQSWTYHLPAGPLANLDGDKQEKITDVKSGLSAQKTIRRSKNSEQRAAIRFENHTDAPLQIYWVDQSGERVAYGVVEAGATNTRSSFTGHAWLLLDAANDPVAAFVVDAWQARAIIDDATAKPQQFAEQSALPASYSNSPDGRWNVSFDGYNVVLADRQSHSERRLSVDGNADDSYGGKVWWSSDSSHFVVMKTQNATERQISMVDSAPDDSVHAKLKTITYVTPGDRLDVPRVVLFHVDQDKPTVIDHDTFDNPFDIDDLKWHADSGSFSFLYNQRGHQVLRLIQVDAKTSVPKTIIDETSKTFVCYSDKTFLHRLDETDEFIWMSERSGWNHLYLIDQTSGGVKNAITSGDWVVRSVVRVDEVKRQIWLEVGGIDPQQDPYHVHLMRVDFDGRNVTRLTHGDGNHRWKFSPDGRYLIDVFSRVDLPPVTQLLNAQSGELICELERADASELLHTGWQFPQRFVAKGRDGETDVYGIIVRPMHFDPNKRYPVLENIYAGPHAAFVPKRFGLIRRMYEMAELGFIVVKIDGMGTSFRSKAFHDVCWQNLGDSGLPDRVAWIKAAASQHPEMDLEHVGIWGGSAGGQSAMRALITHGDFYRAAVADCGCHDNRVDKIWWNEQWMGWPVGPHYANQSNVTQAHRMKGDLMLIWGELDTNVDPASTTQVIDALITADKDFEQLIMPGVGHGAAEHPYARRRQADFFVRKLWRREPRHELTAK